MTERGKRNNGQVSSNFRFYSFSPWAQPLSYYHETFISIIHASLHFSFQYLKRSGSGGLGYASRSTQHFSGGRRRGRYIWRLVGSISGSKLQKNSMRTGAM